jgi:ornithine decarboxylase
MSVLGSRLDLSALPDVDSLVAALRPAEPMHCLRPANLLRNAREFTAAFPGVTMYAVKCNPEPTVLQALWEGGVRHFDCASLPEVALVRGMFADAVIHFMHPVKSRQAIARAYALHGVRDFVLDSAEELEKILAETGDADDLTLIVRLALPKGNAVSDLSGKFGAPPEEAESLLRAARGVAAQIGISFHVGSQCLDPLAWRRAIALAGEAIAASGVRCDIIDVGGGFPAPYPGMDAPPPLGAFMAEIEEAVERLNLGYAPALWAEPGRALVADAVSLVVQVHGRRGDALHINDGVFGSLSDAGAPRFRYPTRLLLRETDAPDASFRFFGPTCDSADIMQGPFMLPADTREGDWIDIGQLGAYGSALRTAFNGFGDAALEMTR